MNDPGLYAVALGAGALAALNPCGFALLPTYLLLLVEPGERSTATALGRALRASAAMTTGFVAVFAVFAAVVVPLSLAVEQHLPWVTVLIGVGLVALGVRALSGGSIGVRAPVIGRAPTGPGASVPAVALYGVAYATASLSCTVAPFLALASSATRTQSLAAGAGVVLAFALGMGLLIGLLGVAVALARQGVVAGLRRALPYVGRLSGGLLVLAGLYVAYYGWYEIRVLGGGAVGDPVVDAALAVQGLLARAVGTGGLPLLAVAAVVVVAAASAVVLGRRRRAGGV